MLRLDFAQYVCVTSKHFEQKGQQLRAKRRPSHHLYRFNWGRRSAEKFIRSEIGLKPCRDSAARKVKEQEGARKWLRFHSINGTDLSGWTENSLTGKMQKSMC